MEKQEHNNAQEAGMKLVTLDINSLVKHPNHPRKDLGNLETLEASIRRDGLQEPPMVMASDQGNFLILDGVRRVEVAKRLGWKEMLCLVRENLNADLAAHLSYLKNIERMSLTPIEIAGHLKRMMDEFGYTLKDLELKGYGSPPTISAKLKLLELPQTVQVMIQKGEISPTHGVHLVKLPTAEEQERMAKRINNEELTVKRAEAQIERYLSKEKGAAYKPKVPVVHSKIPGVYFKDAGDMSEVPSGSVQLIVTTPDRLIRQEENFQMPAVTTKYWDGIRPVIEECSRVLVEGGVLAVVVPDNVDIPYREEHWPEIQTVGHKYQSFLKKGKVKLTGQIIWDTGCLDQQLIRKSKTKFGELYHAEYPIRIHHRFINIFRKSGERAHPSNADMIQKRITEDEWVQWTRSIWAIEAEAGNPDILPEELVRRLILMFTYEGETVLDPFLGTGTTVKVARELGRDAIGYEKDINYKPVIKDKLGPARDVKAPFEGVKRMLLEPEGPEPEVLPKAEDPNHLELTESTVQETETCEGI